MTGTQISVALYRLRRSLEQRLAVAVKHVPDAVQALAFLGGWLLFTHGVVLYTSPRVWPISTGLLLLSLCGWTWIRNFLGTGLYSLNEAERKDG